MTPLSETLARYLRVAPGTEAHAQALPLWTEARELARPRTWSLRLDMAEFLDAFAPQAGQSRDLARTLEGCAEVVLMAATIGPDLEARADEHMSLSRPFAGYMLDRMGSWLVESAMKALHREVRAGHPPGVVTRRYSPGYGDFALDAQAHFLRLIGPALPGLSLSSSCILSPLKSVTALCGIRS